MKGTTHLAIGAAIGVFAAAYYPFTPKNAALYITVASFSALSADLDGPSMLSSKIGKVSKALRSLVLIAGLLLSAGAAAAYLAQRTFSPAFTAAAAVVLLLGFITKEGFIRNMLVSLIGAGLAYAGWSIQARWMIGLGVFVAWAPWLKHRGLTHTVWAVAGWGWIGMQLEQELGLDGIANAAIAGYASHLLADTLTANGVKWLYPLYKKAIKI
ncbi:metal-dependent hydrolase [Paenibacillus protaetiae]|uniref:Metal-dependent hydrolase n=1 Tax=Paenibacillus protaetiae TaxID=2509456 RepID=A0A4V0YFK1_9BACL|nr:metal-dependent hydrolase [Paenibacillus protaetiae]QAY67991.1 metal-dependent hydrolase [Paenibacillus protaetiae]